MLYVIHLVRYSFRSLFISYVIQGLTVGLIHVVLYFRKDRLGDVVVECPPRWCSGRVSASDLGVRGFDPRPGHTEDLKQLVMAALLDAQGCRVSIRTRVVLVTYPEHAMM